MQQTDELKKLDPITKQKVNYQHSKYTALLAKFDEAKYQWAHIIEILVTQNYDLEEWYTDEELNELLDWKTDYELANAQKVAAAKERFTYNEALRASRKRTKVG